MSPLLAWDALGLALLLGIFAVTAAVIGVAGVQTTRVADQLARSTGLGHAWFGAIILGAMTSMPGLVTSLVAAASSAPKLAVSNAVGGIAAQTMFLVIGDIAYRRANLEHSAASLGNLLYGAVLLIVLSTLSAAMAMPDLAIGWVHPFSVLALVLYGAGLRVVTKGERQEMWGPQRTAETEDDAATPDRERRSEATPKDWVVLFAYGSVLAIAGYVVARSGSAIGARTGLTESVVGATLTAVVTSLPELVTTIAAVRRGAVTLAVAGVLGGNAFDCLFVSLSDVAYREGPIYAAVGEHEQVLLAVTAMMTGVLLLGLLRREKHGLANIGFESIVVGVLYLGSLALLFV